MNTPARKPQQGDKDWYGEQNADGVDVSQIRANLRLPLDHRLAKADRAREIVQSLRSYAEGRATQRPRKYRDSSP